MTTEEIIELLNLKDEDIDTSDIPEVTDFSNYHLANEEQLKKIPREILRAMVEERLRSIRIIEQLAKKAIPEQPAV
jgi:hypothetical protein